MADILAGLSLEQRERLSQYHMRVARSLNPTLESSIVNGHLDLVYEMLDGGALVSESDVVAAICLGDSQLLRELLSIWAVTPTLYYAAIEFSRLEMLRVLLDYGPLPPLSLAHAAATSTVPVVQFLLSGGDVMITDHELKAAARADNVETFAYLSELVPVLHERVVAAARGERVRSFLARQGY